MNKISKITIIIFLLGLISLFIKGGHVTFFIKNQVIMTTIQYFILFGIIAIISFLLGNFYKGIQKSWDLKNFIHRIENEETLDYITMLIERKKQFFKKLESKQNDR